MRYEYYSNKKRMTVAGIFIFFILIIYWIEISPWSSAALADYSNGYGTFDMKSYDAQIVYDVLEQMQPRGFFVYTQYLIGDYLFILSFGALQIMLSLYAYSWTKRKNLIRFTVAVPVLRGICDFFENTLLLTVLKTFPVKKEELVYLSQMATKIKFMMIGIWSVTLIVGLLIKLRSKRKGL